MRLVPLIVFAALVCGCSTVVPTANFVALTDTEKSDEASKDAKAAIAADWDKAMSLCDSYMTSARDAYFGSGRAELSIATVGIIAGSVVVPALAAKTAAAKSAIAGWGGVSGAANAAQYAFQQKGLSASRLGGSYEITRAEIKAATAKYTGATRNSQRLAALYDLFVACRYPAIPGADAPTQDSTPQSSEDKPATPKADEKK